MCFSTTLPRLPKMIPPCSIPNCLRHTLPRLWKNTRRKKVAAVPKSDAWSCTASALPKGDIAVKAVPVPAATTTPPITLRFKQHVRRQHAESTISSVEVKELVQGASANNQAVWRGIANASRREWSAVRVVTALAVKIVFQSGEKVTPCNDCSLA